jgi:hypothetical protein
VNTLIVLCSVCFKGTDPVMTGSLNAGILVLLATTACVLGCFGYFFVRLARRARDVAPLDDAPASLQHPFVVLHQPDRAR